MDNIDQVIHTYVEHTYLVHLNNRISHVQYVDLVEYIGKGDHVNLTNQVNLQVWFLVIVMNWFWGTQILI